MELSFNRGQLIHVYGEMDDDGFYMGEIDGVRGLVPSNFLQEVEEYEDGHQQLGSSGRGVQRGRGQGPGARGPPPPPRDNAVRPRKRGI